MNKDRIEELLHMHKFYTEEARHQRSMMWDTVKWFTPILTGLGWLWVNNYTKQEPNIIILVLVSLLGIILSLLSVFLLRSFYRTNLKYITMFAKVEEELNLEKRDPAKKSEYWPDDEFITWNGYIKERIYFPCKPSKEKKKKSINDEKKKYNTSREYFSELTKDILPTKIEDFYFSHRNRYGGVFGYKEGFNIYDLMKTVFYTFFITFSFTFLLSIRYITKSLLTIITG